jgi:hypothetical protein
MKKKKAAGGLVGFMAGDALSELGAVKAGNLMFICSFLG